MLSELNPANNKSFWPTSGASEAFGCFSRPQSQIELTASVSRGKPDEVLQELTYIGLIPKEIKLLEHFVILKRYGATWFLVPLHPVDMDEPVVDNRICKHLSGEHYLELQVLNK